MSNVLSVMVDGIREQIERHRNRPFLHATMAACSLVAAADGNISLRDRVRVDQVMTYLDALQVFDPHEGVELFETFAKEILAHPKAGREEAMKVIEEEVADHPEKAELLIRVCIGVSKASGRVPLIEQIEIVALATQLGVEPSDPLLYSSLKSEGLDAVPII